MNKQVIYGTGHLLDGRRIRFTTVGPTNKYVIAEGNKILKLTTVSSGDGISHYEYEQIKDGYGRLAEDIGYVDPTDTESDHDFFLRLNNFREDYVKYGTKQEMAEGNSNVTI